MHPNEELVRAGYESFVTGDLTAVGNLLDPDVVWHVAGASPLAGDYKGHEGVFGFFAKVVEMTEGTIRIGAREILASEDHAVVLTTTTAQRGDRVLDDHGVAVFRIVDGKAVEVWAFADDQERMDSFFR
ncbi:MAG: nuclear transport factor 2 family protein [Actinomycetota bacterium]